MISKDSLEDFYENKWSHFEKVFSDGMTKALELAFSDSITVNTPEEDTYDNQTTEDSKILMKIEDEISDLSRRLEHIKTDGSETRILLFNDECIKLYAKLDSIGDSCEDICDSLRNQRKQSYSNLEELQKSLHGLALNNLIKLLDSLVEMNRNDPEIQKLLDDFNSVRNKKMSIKEIDNSRYLLEEIKQNITSKSAKKDDNRSNHYYISI